MGVQVKPGHTSLNMEDVAEDLSVVHHHVKKLDIKYRNGNSIDKPVDQKYLDMIQKADDVDLVGGVEAELIAVAADPKDRQTVGNALHLGGFLPEHFMNIETGDSLTKKLGATTKDYAADIADVRDELYQLKHELEKQGLVRNTDQHLGYNDIFRNGYKPYEYRSLGQPGQDCPDRKTLLLTEDMTEGLDNGDFIVIYFRDAAKTNVRQITKIAPDKETVYLDEAIDSSYNIKADNIVIYKSYGVSENGNFYFAKSATDTIGDKTLYTGLDDDTSYKFRRPVNSGDSGYGYSFRVPEQKLGYLTKIDIQARATGTPTLTCYVVDEQDIGNFKNPVQAEALFKNGDTNADGSPKMHFFAKSKPVCLDSTLGQTVVSFDFWNIEKDSYPLLDRKDEVDYRVRYVAVIVGTYVDSNNYADILFLQNKNTDGTFGDLQLNNTTYYYNEQKDTATISALSTDTSLNASDMFYGITIKECVHNVLEPTDRGLYSAKMNCSYPQGISRARLTLRVNREGGLWNAAITKPGIYGGSTVNAGFVCECSPAGSLRSTTTLSLDSRIRKPLELRDAGNPADIYQTPDTIVGNNIVKGTGSGVQVISQSPVMVLPGDMVYRNAYIVSVKGKRYEYNEKAQKYVVADQQKIYLNPVAVIRDGVKYDKDCYSDRIIYEGDFRDENGNAAFFNQLELQVYWEQSNYSEMTDVKQKQMGIIHDLVFSTDRAV